VKKAFNLEKKEFDLEKLAGALLKSLPHCPIFYSNSHKMRTGWDTIARQLRGSFCIPTPFKLPVD